MTQSSSPVTPRLIKKYPNRRLYDTENSAYITLGNVKDLVLQNQTIKVIDSKTEEDITRAILLQIILEEETAGMPMFSAEALAQIIRFYGHAMQGVMGTFLEQNIKAFIDIQECMAEQSRGLVSKQMGSEAWAQFMSVQTPILQNMMSNYIDQSKNVFVQMQDQLQEQTRNMFAGFPFPPPDTKSDSDTDS